MMKQIKAAATLALAAAAVAAPTVASAAPLATWFGRYAWEENLGRHGGSTPGEGIVAFMTYTLALGPGNGSTGCTLNIAGFQTYERYRCTATPQLNQLVIKFYGPAPGGNGRDRYRLGTSMFTLTKTGTGLSTRLQAMAPASDRTPRIGRLFHRVG